MKELRTKNRKRPPIEVQLEETNGLQRELDMLLFSVWDERRTEGHSKFVGNAVETAKYLEEKDLDGLEVSALDLVSMYSLVPLAAIDWLIWYYEAALSKLGKHNFSDSVLVPYPSID